MGTTDKEKIKLADSAFKKFVDQFGENDLIKDAFFDVFLEIIYGEENGDDLSLSIETGQKATEDSKKDGAGEMPTYEIE